MRRHVVPGTYLIVALALLGGCSKKGPTVPTAPVSGTVTYNGQPVAGAEVAFMSKNPDVRSGQGTTDASGHYELSTYIAPTNRPSGAMPGDYKVTVIKRKTAGEAPPSANSSPEEMMKYANKMGNTAPASQPGQSGASAAQNAPKVETELPERYADVETTDLTATVKSGQSNTINLELKD